jgi:hypothetical protein
MFAAATTARIRTTSETVLVSCASDCSQHHDNDNSWHSSQQS